MKNIFVIIMLILSASHFSIAEEEKDLLSEVSLRSLIIAMDEGGLKGVSSYLNKGGKWPRITTDSFAAKNKISNQKDLVDLSDRLLILLQNRVKEESPSEITALEAEADLLFSIGEKLWKADGYRNRVVALLCVEFASFRCGKIILLSKGKKMGPARPDIFKVSDSRDMLALFISVIPENAPLSGSGLDEKLIDEPVAGETWLEMLVELRKIELGGSSIGAKFNEAVSLRMDQLGGITSSENISALVIHQGWAQVLHESMLGALALYLKNGGSVETLIAERVNATKFEEVMKEGVYRFSQTPLMTGNVSGDQLAGLVEDIQSPNGIAMRLFGTKK